MRNFLLLALFFIPATGMAEEQGITGLTAHDIVDNRTTLNLSERMKHRLLSNMREQLVATRTIIGLLAQDNFARASNTTRTKLGKNEELKKIYDSANNEELNKMGMAAMTSAEDLAKTMETNDMKKSLQALRKTMGYCVQCHKKFRQ